MAIRGLPKHRDWIVEVPINISDHIEVLGRQSVRIPHWGDLIHAALLDLQGVHLQLEVFDPPMLFRGVVSNILEPTTWISPRGSTGFRCTLEFRGNRIVTELADVPTGAPTGMMLTAITTTAIGEAT